MFVHKSKNCKKFLICLMINKSVKETNKLTYNQSYITSNTRGKVEAWTTGGEALHRMLKSINLIETWDYFS